MASTYTTRIRLEKQGDGENPNSWGDILNQNVIDLVDSAVAAYTTVSISVGDVTLTTNDGSTDQARSAFLEFVGDLTTSINVIVPGVSKGYGVRTNFSTVSSGATITLKTAAGAGYSIPTSAANGYVFCDGVSVHGLNASGLGLGNAANRDIGTGAENVPDVSIADARYARLSATNTFTAANTFNGATVSIEASATSFRNQVYGPVVSLTDGTSIAVDMSTSNHFAVTLGGNRTLQNPTNAVAGQVGHIYVYQDGTGSRTLSFGDSYRFAKGAAPRMTTSINSTDLLVFSVRGVSAIDVLPVLDLKPEV
tara:strand:+ start:1274 stop:2200 length:927 start_codon:yes stop_codon:yes gene_type:complete